MTVDANTNLLRNPRLIEYGTTGLPDEAGTLRGWTDFHDGHGSVAKDLIANGDGTFYHEIVYTVHALDLTGGEHSAVALLAYGIAGDFTSGDPGSLGMEYQLEASNARAVRVGAGYGGIDITNQAVGDIGTAPFPALASSWTPIEVSTTFTAAATYACSWIRVWVNVATGVAGDTITLRWRYPVLTKTVAAVPYFDGATAGCNWSGTADQSTSVRVSAPLFIGDSLTAGLYAEAAINSFAHQLSDWITGLGYATPSTLSMSGGTTADAAAEAATIEADAPLICLIELGTNDLATDPVAFEASYRTILDAALAGNADCLFVLMSTWRESLADAGAPGREVNDAIIEAIAAEYGDTAVYVDISAIKDEPTMAGPAGVETVGGVSDAWHPNNAGHAALFAVAQAAMDELLGIETPVVTPPPAVPALFTVAEARAFPNPVLADGSVEITQDDSYAAADDRELSWTNTAWPSLTGHTVEIVMDGDDYACTVTATDSFTCALTSAQTTAMDVGTHDFAAYVVIPTADPLVNSRVTLLWAAWTVVARPEEDA
jgi:lysophospholipase L1-like esterase